MTNQLKDIKAKIETLSRITGELKPIYAPAVITETIQNDFGQNRPTNCLINVKVNTKEIEKAVDSLFLAKSWVSLLIGEPSNHVDDIEIDRSVSWETYSHKEKVEWIIGMIKIIPTFNINSTIYTHLTEARFWLEGEIQRSSNE